MNEMASQVIGGAVSQLQVLQIHSFLRGYQAYMEIWTPVVGEMLVVKIEPANRHDIHYIHILHTCSREVGCFSEVFVNRSLTVNNETL